MPDSIGDSAQIRMIAEQVGESAAEIAISKFAATHPEVRRGTVVAEIPAPLRWAAIIASAVITVSASGGLIWLVSTVSEISVTMARMDERMANYTVRQAEQIEALSRRIERLEGYHREGGR